MNGTGKKTRNKWMAVLAAGAMLSSILPPSLAAADTTGVGEQEPLVRSAADATVPAGQVAAAMMDKVKVSKEKAMEIAKSFAKVPADFELARSELQSSWYLRDVPVWQFHWNKNDKEKPGSYFVSVDAINGTVLNMEMWQEANQQASFPPKVNKAEAVKIAAAYMDKQFSAYMDQVRLLELADADNRTPLDGRVNYNFTYVRMVNGIAFPEQNISVNVNGNGEITNARFYWDANLQFPDATATVTQEEAEKLLKERLSAQPAYIQIWKREYVKGEANSLYYLGYPTISEWNTPVVDAESGELKDIYGEKLNVTTTDYAPLAAEALADKPTPLPAELTQDEALNLIKKHFTIEKNIELREARYMDGWGEAQRAVWNFYWGPTDKSELKTGLYGMGASVDARTGEILEFNREIRIMELAETDTKQSITQEQAQEKAVTFLKKVSPYYLHQIYLAPSEQHYDKENGYLFHFGRLVNGIPVNGQGIYVRMSAKDGDIISYYVNWSGEGDAFPSPAEGMVDAETAQNLLWEKVRVELQYVIPSQRYTPEQNQQKTERKPILAYRLVNKNQNDRQMFLDALSGQWRNTGTGEIIRGNEIPEDIKGHWAEKELTLIYRYNGFEMTDDQHVNPDQYITRGEMVRMLMLSMNGGEFYYYGKGGTAAFADVKESSRYFSYIQAAADMNLLDKNRKEFKPEEQVNREELAVLIVKALGYGGLAEYQQIFTLSFTDADRIQAKGQVAIVSGLGIMNGSNNQFMPAEKVTRAQAATAFYRFLEKKAELKENQIRW